MPTRKGQKHRTKRADRTALQKADNRSSPKIKERETQNTIKLIPKSFRNQPNPADTTKEVDAVKFIAPAFQHRLSQPNGFTKAKRERTEDHGSSKSAATNCSAAKPTSSGAATNRRSHQPYDCSSVQPSHVGESTDGRGRRGGTDVGAFDHGYINRSTTRGPKFFGQPPGYDPMPPTASVAHQEMEFRFMANSERVPNGATTARTNVGLANRRIDNWW